MKEYIEREALFKRINTGMNTIEALQAIIDCPTADVRENVHGEWVINTTAAGRHYTSCSICSNVLFARTDDGVSVPLDIRNSPFCPVCGADMRKGAQG